MFWMCSRRTAQASTCGTHGNYFDGYISTAAGPVGHTRARALLSITNTARSATGILNPSSNFTYVWVMSAANSSLGAGRGYAQMGYFCGYNQCTYFAAEYHRDAAIR